MNPVQRLLWLFGIETNRRKIKTMEDFNSLEQRQNAIIGSMNMSYAPHFMPSYKEAFAFANEDGHMAAAALIQATHDGRGGGTKSQPDAEDDDADVGFETAI